MNGRRGRHVAVDAMFTAASGHSLEGCRPHRAFFWLYDPCSPGHRVRALGKGTSRIGNPPYTQGMWITWPPPKVETNTHTKV